MPFLLDTNTLIALFNQRSLTLVAHLKSHHPSEIMVSSIVMHELYYGAYKSLRVEQNLAKIASIPFATIEFDKEDAMCAGEIRAILTQAGTPIGGLDVLIAGQAKSRSYTLITHNTKEFMRVDGLKYEDWLI